MFNNIKAAIFDLDGTLVDSMWVWGDVDITYLKNLKLEVPEDLRDNIEHLSFEQVAIYFKNRFNINDSIDNIMDTWNSMAYEKYSKEVKLKAGVKEFLDFLKLNNIKIALATSNCNMLLEAALKSNNIFDYFDSITTTNEVSKGKDYPDVYLLAAKKLGVDPSECIVFEDILPAVKGAKLAGMKVVGVYDSFSVHQENFIKKEVVKYIKDFRELTSAI